MTNTFEIPQIGQDMVAVMVTAPYTIDVSGGPTTEYWAYLQLTQALTINNPPNHSYDTGIFNQPGLQPTIGFSVYDGNVNPGIYVGSQLTILSRFAKRNIYVNPNSGPGPILSDLVSGGNYLYRSYIIGDNRVLFVPSLGDNPSSGPFFRPTSQSLNSFFNSGQNFSELAAGAILYPQRHVSKSGKIFFGVTTNTTQYLYCSDGSFRIYENPGIAFALGAGVAETYCLAGPLCWNRIDGMMYFWNFNEQTGQWTFDIANSPTIQNGAYGLLNGAAFQPVALLGGWLWAYSNSTGIPEIYVVHWSGGGYFKIKVYPGDLGAQQMFDLDSPNFAIDAQGYLYWSAGAAPYGVGVVDSGMSFMVSDVPVFTPKFFKFFPGGMNSNSSAMGHFRMNWRKR